jgi:hypothetical protein
MLIIMIASSSFNPAIMNPASIILPTSSTIEHFTDINYIDLIIFFIFILLIVLVYLRLTHKI